MIRIALNDATWEIVHALDSLSGNREHFDRVVEIVKDAKAQGMGDCYAVRDNKMIRPCDSDEFIQLSKQDEQSLNIVLEQMDYCIFITVYENSVEFYRDTVACTIVYVEDDVRPKRLSGQYPAETKKIDTNWYNAMRKR